MQSYFRFAASAALLVACACGGSNSQAERCAAATPEATAGPAQSAGKRATVNLRGTAAKTTGDIAYAWRLDPPPGSKAALSSSSAAAPSFTTDVSGAYVATLFVRDACATSAPSTTVVTVVNHAPVASAGPDRQAMPGDTVTLDGSGSADQDQDALQYHWTLVSRPVGSAATLSSATVRSPTFTPDLYGTYAAILVVSDGDETSDPADVIVQAGVTGPNGTCPPAPAPVASAGPDQNIGPFTSPQLDGTASANGRPGALAFNWSLASAPAGSRASIDQPHAARSFLSSVDKPGTYVVSLVVNDGCVDSTAATVRITRPNSVPSVFIPAPFQPVPLLVPFNLQGIAFDFDNEPLTYQWEVVSRPQGSAAAIADPKLPSTTFAPDLEGTYVFSLVVSDAVSSSSPAQVTFTVVNQPPVARVGADQAVGIGATVTLDGSSSSDPSLRTLAFAWTLQPAAGSTATLSNPSAAKTTFTADVPGIYRAQLTVTAGGLSSQANATVGVWPAVARLSHRVIDAAYSAALDRVIIVAADPSALYLFDPHGTPEATVALSFVPASVAVEPDGLFAAVGHANGISYVDLQTKTVVRVLTVQGDVGSVSLSDNGFAFAFPSVPAGDHLRLVALPLAGGPSSLVISAMTGVGRGRFRRVNGTLYVTSNPGQFGFSGIEEYAVGSGVPAPVTRPAGVNVGTCGDLWLSEATTRLFTRCGSVLRASSSSTDDLSSAGVLPRPSAVALLLRHVSDSTVAGEISAVASADDPFVFSPPDDRTLRRWAADGLALRESLPFPTETIGGALFRWQGRFVFYRSDGTERYVLMQLETAAGALQDFGFVTF